MSLWKQIKHELVESSSSKAPVEVQVVVNLSVLAELLYLVFSSWIKSGVFLQGMKVFFLIVVVLYILYLIFLVVRACSELKNMPYSGIIAWLTSLHLIHTNSYYYDYINHDKLLTNALCVFSITRSPAQVFDSADICSPCNKVSCKEDKRTTRSFFKALCGKFDIIWFWAALSPLAWSFSTWGLVPRLSRTTLLLNCLLITKTISFFNDILFWPWFHFNVPHEIACWCLKLREILPLLQTYQLNFYHSMAYSTSTCTH